MMQNSNQMTRIHIKQITKVFLYEIKSLGRNSSDSKLFKIETSPNCIQIQISVDLNLNLN